MNKAVNGMAAARTILAFNKIGFEAPVETDEILSEIYERNSKVDAAGKE